MLSIIVPCAILWPNSCVLHHSASHVMGIEVPAVTGVDDEIGLGDRAAEGFIQLVPVS